MKIKVELNARKKIVKIRMSEDAILDEKIEEIPPVEIDVPDDWFKVLEIIPDTKIIVEVAGRKILKMAER
ncbi:MAG: hypothetical protein NDF52_05245 [archaeon YNP-WB-062]|nr:hypothetical protein [Candidatus Culexarchaeum yellowstonense]